MADHRADELVRASAGNIEATPPPVGGVYTKARRRRRLRAAAWSIAPLVIGSAAFAAIADVATRSPERPVADGGGVGEGSDNSFRFEVDPCMRLDQIVFGLADASGLDESAFWSALDSGAVTSAYLPALPPTLPAGFSPWQGLLAPDVYEIANGSSAAEVLQMLADRQSALADMAGLKNAAETRGLSAYQLLTLASLIEGEGIRAEFAPRVAATLYNRMEVGDFLGIDSAVRYGQQKFSEPLETDDFHDDDPYNTRRSWTDPIPPSPICAPSEGSIRAVANPAAGDWRFWLTSKDGETKFYSTYESFLEGKAYLEDNDLMPPR